MRLVYAIDHLAHGGAQRQVVELAACLARDPQTRPRVLVYHPHDFFGDRLREAGVEVVQVRKRGRFDAGLPLRIAAWMREARPDLVHAFLAAPALWCTLARLRLPRAERPVLVSAERAGRLGVGRAQGLAERIAYRGADAVTVNAMPMAEDMHGLGVPRDRIHYLPNGIDLEAWDRGRQAPCPLPLEPGRVHLALVGRLEPQKDHATLLEALHRLGPETTRTLRVWFVGGVTGEPAHKAMLERRVAELGLAEVVTFCEPVQQVGALMAHLDLLVLPSIFEGFPNVLLEAMASGLPSVSATVGNVASMIEDGHNGLCVPPSNPEALAQALRRALALDPEERRAMGRAARATVEQRYRIETVAADYLALYQRLCAAGGR